MSSLREMGVGALFSRVQDDKGDTFSYNRAAQSLSHVERRQISPFQLGGLLVPPLEAGGDTPPVADLR